MLRLTSGNVYLCMFAHMCVHVCTYAHTYVRSAYAIMCVQITILIL